LLKKLFSLTILIILGFLSLSSSASDINVYQNITQKISNKFCSNGEEHKFKKLYNKFKGNRFYIPVNDLNPMWDVINRNNYLFKEKLNWLESIIKNNKNTKNYSNQLKKIDHFNKKLNKFFLLQTTNNSQFKNKWNIYKKAFNNFTIKQLNFLLPFRYPVNYKQLRLNYEKSKVTYGKNDKKSKELYYIRKFFEDGSINQYNSRSDKTIRALVNKLLIELPNTREISLEHFRDLSDFFKITKNYLTQSPNNITKRLIAWKNRINNNMNFVNFKNKKNLLDYIAENKHSTSDLKKFVYSKQAKIFKYMSGYKKKWRKLFVLESILTHEVGGLKGLELDKFDIARVVLNRVNNKKYNFIGESNELNQYLNIPSKKFNFLNTLFKEGEFSFTYFFIPSVVRMFCPDQSKRGKLFRRKNIIIAQKVLHSSRLKEFNALRYFSRVSILGRYKMDDVWVDYNRSEIKFGKKLAKKRSQKLLRLVSHGKVTFVKNVLFKNNLMLNLIKVKDHFFYYDKPKKIFYYYRDPDLFSYFEPK